MVNFYKLQAGQNELLFQLKDLMCTEHYSVWDNATRQFFRGDSKLQDGTLVKDTKFVRKEDFARRYPSLRKSTQYIRTLYIYPTGPNATPTEYNFGFTKTANDSLRQCIEVAKVYGGDPTETLYRLRKTGTGLETTYEVVALDRIGHPSPIAAQTAPIQAAPAQPQPQPQNVAVKAKTEPSKAFIVPNMQNVVLPTPQERAVLDQALMLQSLPSEDVFVEGFNLTMRRDYNTIVEISRIRELYRQYFLFDWNHKGDNDA